MHAFLILGALPVVFFVAMLSAGTIIGLTRLVRPSLFEARGTKDLNAPVTLSKPMAPPAGLPEAVNSESFVDEEPAYA